jgi:hypothetical protein
MSKIHVYGWYNHANIGDESYKIAFPKLFPEQEFIFCDSLKNQNPETIILGGGDIFFPPFLDKLKEYNCKKYALSVNLRPEMEEYYSMFDTIVSRNPVNVKNLKNNITKIHCFPDFTFCLEGNKERGKALVEKIFQENKSELYQNLVIITMNAYVCARQNMLARDYVTFEKTSFELANLMDNTSASFLFLPFGNDFPTNDRIANSSVYAGCKWWKKNALVYNKLSVQDTLDLYTVADAAIGMRLHACIFSCISETPFVNICHHSKTQYFTESIGHPEWNVDYWHFSATQTKSILDSFLSEKEYHKQHMAEISQKNKNILNNIKDINLLP